MDAGKVKTIVEWVGIIIFHFYRFHEIGATMKIYVGGGNYTNLFLSFLL